MTYWGFTANLEELDSVCALLGPFPPAETDGEGVWVRIVDGTRVWSASTNGTLWEVQGEVAETPIETRCLPARAVWEARILALTSDEHEVVFSIPDDLVCCFSNSVGSGVMDLPRVSQIRSYPMYVAEQASAKTTVGAFFDLLFRARMTPTGPSTEDFPDARFFVRDSAVSIYVDWSSSNGARTTCTIPAEVRGDAERLIDLMTAQTVMRELDRDLEITIRVPQRTDIGLLVEGEEFRVAVACMSSGASRHHEKLRSTLNSMSGYRTRVVDMGKFAVTSKTRDFFVDLTDRVAETISVHTEVCRDVPLTLELLTQINETNGSLVGARLWTADGVVWAGLDLPVSAMDELVQAIRTLDQQLVGFDVFLSGLGVAL